MNTRFKHLSKSSISVLLALLMIVSTFTVGIITTTAAYIEPDDTTVGAAVTGSNDGEGAVGAKDDEEPVGAIDDSEKVGASYYLLLGDNNNNPSQWTKYVTSSSRSFTITPSSFGLSSFTIDHNYYVAISSSSSYTNMWSQGGDAKIGTTSGSIKEAAKQDFNIGNTTYNFARFQLNAAVDSVTVTTSHSSGTTTYNFSTAAATWTAIGSSTALFGTAWAPTATVNDMTPSGSTYTWTKSNVYLTAGTIEYKVAKNHTWTTYPTGDNKSVTVSSAGYYNVTMTYVDNTSLTMTLTDVTPHTLTVANNADAVVKATYNGVTANEGGTLSVPPNKTVTVTVTPNTGKKLNSISSSAGGATTVSGNTGTLTMPAANTTLSITLDDVTTKKVYFNNMYTGYAMVSAYVKYASDTFEPLGVYPGSTMTKMPNSNIWYIEVPEDVDYITFIGDNGVNTNDTTAYPSNPDGMMSIPWTNTNPKYTAPLGHNDAPTKTNGGTWGSYIVRSNEVNVTNGDTITNGINNDTLFAGITATMYDYYADGEVNSGATSWLNGINTTENSKEYTTEKNDWKWNSFTKLNSALSNYASKYSVSKPLYFGNLNVWSDNGNGNAIGNVGHSNKSTITSYTNWDQLANGSITLSDSDKKNAVTGLTGKTLANSNIHYYKSGSTTENGAVMAMFDEDFLSGENNQNKALATILRSSFPVRKESVDPYIALDCSWYFDSNANVWAHLWDDAGNVKDVHVTANNQKVLADGYTHVKFVRNKSDYGSSSLDWTADHIWNQTGNLNIQTNNRKFTITSDNNGSSSGSWGARTTATGDTHTYYEFDSTGGKDNAYVESITKPTSSAKGSATLNYYNNTNKVYSSKFQTRKNKEGFFPFDHNNIIDQVDDHAHDLGFGMKLEIPFTLEAGGQFSDGTAQVFDFSGDDDLWVFVDNQLVLDLGGEHNATTGSINFKDRTVTASNTQAIGSATRNGSFSDWFDNSNPNVVHTMTIYYMERGMFDSNLKFGFSFHAIPNQLKTEKKVRTHNINSGFYILNDTTRSDTTVDDGERYVTWFEKSYLYDHFEITQSSGSAPKNNPVTYTLRDATNYSGTLLPSDNYAFQYSLNNDNIAYFLGQYNSGTNITLKETTLGSSNRYNYDPSVVVYDDANNSSVVSGTGDISTGYSFNFSQTIATQLENLNLRARVTNQMKSHDLTISKTVNDINDTTTSFTLQILFNFDMAAVTGVHTATTKDYHAYPLYVTVNGNSTQLGTDGTISIKPGDVLVIPKVPENAQMQITESLPSNSPYGYKSTTVTNGVDVTNVTNGVQFKMGTSDASAVVDNYKGSLMITHQPHPDSTALGNTLVSAKVKNGSTTVATYAETSDGITVDPQYIKSNSTYNLEIVLRSEVVDDISYFEDFYEKITGTMRLLAASGTPYTAVINKTNLTATITVPISGLFTSGNQTYTLLPFYSKFITSQYKYVLSFDFQGYRDLYGYLGYDYSAQTFTMAELSDYFEMSDEVIDTNHRTVTAPVFKSDSAREAFINLKAPYENTFMETVKWQTDMFSSDHPEGMTATYNSETCTWTYIVKLKKTPNRYAFATFRFPYAVDTFTNKHAAQTSTITYGGQTFDAVVLLSGGAYQEYGGRSETDTQYRTGYGSNYFIDKTNRSYLTAPKAVWDTSTNSYKYFSYWSVWNVADAASKTGSKEYTRCYYPEFNLSLYQDSIIYPVYNDTEYLSPSERAQRDDAARQDAYSTNGRATITLMENSRMQWTIGREGNTLTGNYVNGGDRIYTDFLVSYTYQDQLLCTDTTKVAGIVIETVRDLDSTEGVYYTKTQGQYEETDNSSVNKAAVKTFIENGTGDNFLKTQFAATTLDNKNRKNQYYSLPNISQTTHDATTRKNKLYRAYSYLRSSANGSVLLISDPIYFTIYDIASISNMQGGASYGGVS